MSIFLSIYLYLSISISISIYTYIYIIYLSKRSALSSRWYSNPKPPLNQTRVYIYNYIYNKIICYLMYIYICISRTFFVTSFKGHLDQKEKNATYNILVCQVTSFLLCEVTFFWVWVSQMGLGYRFRATSLTCHSPLGLRLRLPPCNACQSVSKRVRKMSFRPQCRIWVDILIFILNKFKAWKSDLTDPKDG